MNLGEIPIPVLIRLRNLEVLVEHYGYANRSMMAELHGLSEAQTSKDISLYKELNPESCFYNRATRRIERLSNFKRIIE